MLRRAAIFRDYIKLLSRRRWLVVVLVMTGVVLYETIEHKVLFGGIGLVPDFVRDVFFYGLVSFFAGNYIFNRLDRLSSAYQQSETSYNSLQKLIQQLAEAQDEREAATIVIQSVRVNLKISGAQLLLSNPSNGSFYLAASWSHKPTQLLALVQHRKEQACSLNKPLVKNESLQLTPCVCTGEEREEVWSYSYCLPLNGSDQPVGILYLYHTEELKINPNLEKLLLGMTTEMVTTLDRIRLQVTLDRHGSSHISIQQRIARDMHATLGHNLAYLRMKLAQIVTTYQAVEAPLVEDLIQLQNTTTEAYQQMRDLLVALTPEEIPHLRSTLTNYAQRIADRAGFNLDIHYSGEARPLPPLILQQIIWILREALGNIENHARANQVEIGIAWQDDGLAIHITDDGRGFDTHQPLTKGHFGIHFMEERASEVNGKMILTSGLNSGTQFSLWIPYQQNPEVK